MHCDFRNHMGSFHWLLANKGCNSFKDTLEYISFFFIFVLVPCGIPELFLIFSKSRHRGRDRNPALKKRSLALSGISYLQKQIIIFLEFILLLRTFHNAVGLSMSCPCEWDLWRILRGECGFSWPLETDCYSPLFLCCSPGATKSSLLSAPSIVSMFVPAPEEFADEQPTVMTDK